MLRKYGIFLIALSLVCVFSACGTKEQAEDTDAPAAAVEESSAEIVPGEMVLIPEGEFIFGTDISDSDAYTPDGKMSLPAYWIDKYEVTNMEFLDFSIAESYTGEGAKEGKDWRLFFTGAESAYHPVVFVTWNDAVAYCTAKGKRLPTEFEWEKAGRGAEGFRYPWGNGWESNRSNTHEASIGEKTDIGKFADVSPYGVHDMLGNVQEWTATKYQPYKGNPKKDPNVSREMRTLRGLSSNFRGRIGSVYERMGALPGALYNFGFRCAKDATPEEAPATQ